MLLDRLHGDAGYLSSPERGGTIPPRAYTAGYVPSATATYEDPYYAQYGSRTGSITPVIDEETRCVHQSFKRFQSTFFFLFLISLCECLLNGYITFKTYRQMNLLIRLPRLNEFG